jgi:hypothetical protein
MVHALAEIEGLNVSDVVRRLIRREAAEAFGTTPEPRRNPRVLNIDLVDAATDKTKKRTKPSQTRKRK